MTASAGADHEEGQPRPAAVLPEYDAVVLTGGRARRLGGTHKPGIVIGGRSLAARVIGAVRDASRVIVVGPAAPECRADVVTRESPPGGGPAAALDAGMWHVQAPMVAALAADLPFLTAEVVDELRLALLADPGAAAAILVDDDGRDQRLCAVWRSELLRDALATVADPAAAGSARPAPAFRGAPSPGRPADPVRPAGSANQAEPAGPPGPATLPGLLRWADLGASGRLAGVSLRELFAAAEPVVRRTVTVTDGPPPWFDCDTAADVVRAREWT